MSSVVLLLLLVAIHHKPHSIIPGSHENMVIQNQEIDRLKLPRIVDDNQLHQLEQTGELVKVEDNEEVIFSPNIGEDRRFVRPWTYLLVRNMGSSFRSRFNTRLVIDSAVRTVEQQQNLRRYNRYAAPEVGELPSSHLAGITVDIAKRRYNRKQRQWIVSYLKELQDSGYLVASEEPACYHVAVMEKYNELGKEIQGSRVSLPTIKDNH